MTRTAGRSAGQRTARTMLGTTAATALVAGALVTAGAPAQAGGATVTRGTLVPLPGASASEPGVTGHVQLVRTGAGTTLLTVHVSGLRAGVTYGSHLHGAPCSAGAGGGHYRLDPLGVPAPPNELWASSDPHDPTAGLTANAAGRASGHGAAAWTAGPTATSVVVHIGSDRGGTTAGGVKIACADLG